MRSISSQGQAAATDQKLKLSKKRKSKKASEDQTSVACSRNSGSRTMSMNSTASTTVCVKSRAAQEAQERWMVFRKHLYLAAHTKPDILNRYLSDFYSLNYLFKNNKLFSAHSRSAQDSAASSPLALNPFASSTSLVSSSSGLKSLNYFLLKQISKSARKLKFGKKSAAGDEKLVKTDLNNNEKMVTRAKIPSEDSGICLDDSAVESPKETVTVVKEKKASAKGIGNFRRREFFLRFLDFNFFILF